MRVLWIAAVLVAASSCVSGTSPTAPQQFRLTVQVQGSGDGSVQRDALVVNRCSTPCTSNHNQDTDVVLTAQADPGSVFGGWSGTATDCTSAATQVAITVHMDRNKTCTVTFHGVAVISDDFDDAGAFARWDIAFRYEDPVTSTSESNPSTGGLPATGGYRFGRHDFPGVYPPAATVRVDHVLRGDANHPGTYDPRQTGLIDSLVVSMDRLVIHPSNPGAMVGSFFVMRQGTKLFYARIDPGDFFSNLGWQPVRKTLVPSDFFSSPAGTTPNFESPMEFGFRRSTTASNANNVFITWGTDNFRVEVWHR
jgi:hypothetical protein